MDYLETARNALYCFEETDGDDKSYAVEAQASALIAIAEELRRLNNKIDEITLTGEGLLVISNKPEL